MKHLDLFSGIGGFALACQWAGIETIGFVEIDKYCQKVLRKHWPNVPIVEDIRDVEKIKEIVANATQPEGSMDGQIIGISEQGQLRGGNSERNMGCQRRGEHRSGIGKQSTEPLPSILITAGFPCQPFSVAGKRGGKEDDRYLWPQTIAVIKAVKPTWILLENVTGIINLALDTVLSDLEGAGYSTETLIIPACAVNAPHRRDRIWIVAHDSQLRRSRQSDSRQRGDTRNETRLEIEQCSEDVADTKTERLDGQNAERDLCPTGCVAESGQGRWGIDWWAVEPELGRVAHGIPHRVDRLKCLGNAIVPQVAYEIIRVIKEIELRSVLSK